MRCRGVEFIYIGCINLVRSTVSEKSINGLEYVPCKVWVTLDVRSKEVS